MNNGKMETERSVRGYGVSFHRSMLSIAPSPLRQRTPPLSLIVMMELLQKY